MRDKMFKKTYKAGKLEFEFATYSGIGIRNFNLLISIGLSTGIYLEIAGRAIRVCTYIGD